MLLSNIFQNHRFPISFDVISTINDIKKEFIERKKFEDEMHKVKHDDKEKHEEKDKESSDDTDDEHHHHHHGSDEHHHHQPQLTDEEKKQKITHNKEKKLLAKVSNLLVSTAAIEELDFSISQERFLKKISSNEDKERYISATESFYLFERKILILRKCCTRLFVKEFLRLAIPYPQASQYCFENAFFSAVNVYQENFPKIFKELVEDIISGIFYDFVHTKAETKAIFSQLDSACTERDNIFTPLFLVRDAINGKVKSIIGTDLEAISEALRDLDIVREREDIRGKGGMFNGPTIEEAKEKLEEEAKENCAECRTCEKCKEVENCKKCHK